MATLYILSSKDSFIDNMEVFQIDEDIFNNLMAKTDKVFCQKIVNYYGKDYINKNLIIAIFNMNITLTKDLFKIIFDKISNELKLALLVRHLDLFNAEELKNLFAKMDGEYKALSNREKRHNIYLPINDENKRLGDYLYKIGYISNEDRYAKNKEENQLLFRINGNYMNY